MTTNELQEKIFSFLTNPDTHYGNSVTRIDTHAASVFLAGNRAYKVKRAVRFPFLDYSTVEKRRAACFRELEINRRFAPHIYLNVSSITVNSDGTFEFDGKGEPIEWVVVMERFDEKSTLDCLAQNGLISDELAEQLGQMVARFHADAPLFDSDRWLKFLPEIILDNDTALRQRDDLFDSRQINFLRDTSNSSLDRIALLLKNRGNLGFIREGHGDLHLGNIVLINGVAIPFDALEFDALIAAGDVLYDLCFLLMDLIDRGLSAKANIVLNRYLTETRQNAHLDGLAALPLFLSLRASIRAKVMIARLAQKASGNLYPLIEQARIYFHHAINFLSPPGPKLVAVGGFSGTGKSALARGLAPRIAPSPGAIILRSDVERKLMFGVTEKTQLPSEAYCPEVGFRVYESLGEKARSVVSAGHSVIVDAVFSSFQERKAISAIADACNVPFVGIFLETDLQTRLDRVKSRVNDASDADAMIATRQEAIVVGPMEWLRLNASSGLEETITSALRTTRV
jgi:hypothetical protein